MKRRGSKRKVTLSSQSFSSDQGPPPTKRTRKACGESIEAFRPEKAPMGYFSILPTEIMEKIFQFLPISSIVNLSQVSRHSLNITEKWISRRTISRTILNDMRHLFYESSSKTFTSACTTLGDLIRLTTLFQSDNGATTRLWWLKQLMLGSRINSWSSDTIIHGLGAFLGRCFISSKSEEIDAVMKVLFGKLRTRTLINTQLKAFPGSRRRQEARTRGVMRALFTNCRLLGAAIKFLSTGSKSYPQLAPSGLARLAFVLYGPMSVSKPNLIGWDIPSKAFPSQRCMMPLGHFLSLSFWREDPFCLEKILHALLDDHEIGWSAACIGSLFVALDESLSIPYLMQKSNASSALVLTPPSATLIAVGKISLGRMNVLLNGLRKRVAANTYNEVVSKMLSSISDEIEVQEKICQDTCGNCENCKVCPMKALKSIQASIKSEMKLISPPKAVPTRRYSVRLAERSKNGSGTVQFRKETTRVRVLKRTGTMKVSK